MSGPRTDKERILDLEARLAAANEELAAWRANDAGYRIELGEIDRVWRLRQVIRLKGLGARAASSQCAKLLDALLARPDRVLARDQAVALVKLGDDMELRTVDVLVSFLRTAFRAQGIDQTIQSVRGHGHLITADKKAEICALLGVTYD